MIVQAVILNNEFKNYTFKITVISPYLHKGNDMGKYLKITLIDVFIKQFQ